MAVQYTVGKGCKLLDTNSKRKWQVLSADDAKLSKLVVFLPRLHIDPKSSHRPRSQRRHTKGKKQSTSRVPCTNTAQLSNAMPEQNMVQTSQVLHQPLQTTTQLPTLYQQFQHHLPQQLPYPQQSMPLNPTGPVCMQTPPSFSCNEQHLPTGSLGQMHMPATQMPPFDARATSPQIMWHSGMSPNKYEVVLLESCVKKCYGCGTAFADKFRRPPFNLVVKHLDRRVLGKNNITGQLLYSNDYSNTYYHLSVSHMQRKNPVFSGIVHISSVLYYSLDTEQRNYLASSGVEVRIF